MNAGPTRLLYRLLYACLLTAWFQPLGLSWPITGCMAHPIGCNEVVATSGEAVHDGNPGNVSSPYVSGVPLTMAGALNQQRQSTLDLCTSDTTENSDISKEKLSGDSATNSARAVATENSFTERLRPVFKNFLIYNEKYFKDLTVQLGKVRFFEQAHKIAQRGGSLKAMSTNEFNIVKGKVSNINCASLMQKIGRMLRQPVADNIASSALWGINISLFDEIMSDFIDLQIYLSYINECYVDESGQKPQFEIFESSSSDRAILLRALELEKKTDQGVGSLAIVDGIEMYEHLKSFFSAMLGLVNCLNTKVSIIGGKHFHKYVRDGQLCDETNSFKTELMNRFAKAQYGGCLQVNGHKENVPPKRLDIRRTQEGVSNMWPPNVERKFNNNTARPGRLSADLIKNINDRPNMTNSQQSIMQSNRFRQSQNTGANNRCTKNRYNAAKMYQQSPVVAVN
ncbi:hypothetical protein VCUG_01370, partial [Vavraia culicis subsp. floridensis]